MWLDLMKAPRIEGEPLVVNVVPSASEAAQLVFDHHLSRRLACPIFHPDSTSGEVPQSDGVIRVSDHVPDVPMQPHLGIAEDGDAGPGPARKPIAQKAIYRLADFFMSSDIREMPTMPPWP